MHLDATATPISYFTFVILLEAKMVLVMHAVVSAPFWQGACGEFEDQVQVSLLLRVPSRP